MHDFDIGNSIFELPLFINLSGSNTFFGIQKVTEYQVFNIKLYDFEYQITNSIVVIQYSIFELPQFFILLGSKTFFSIWKVTEYQVFNIKTNF